MTEPSAVAPATVDQAPDPGLNPGYWHELIPEKDAAEFLGVTRRHMQGMRQRGGGPRFIRLSSRCLRYTRTLLKVYADAHLCSSTSDPDQVAA